MASTTLADNSVALVVDAALEARIAALFNQRYRVIRQLRDSAQGATLLATDLVDGGNVVIKPIGGKEVSAGMRRRLLHDAALVQRTKSPWLAPMLDVGEDEDTIFLVMGHVEGASLAERFQSGPIVLADALAVGRCLFSALSDLHRRRVLHRGIQPNNIIFGSLTQPGSATLIDFGPGCEISSASLVEQDAVESALYLSPEQAGSIDDDVAEPADLYAAGTVLFHCLAGCPPFSGDSVGTLLFAHMTTPPPELRALAPEVPRALDELVQRLLRKDPRDRYQSAHAVLTEFNAIASALERGEADPKVVIGALDRRGTLTKPAFVAREREVSQFDKQIERTQQGQGGLVSLESESGNGKSRLLVEIAQRGARAGLWVMQKQGTNEVARRPFHLLDGIVDGLITAARSDPTLVSALKEKLGTDRDALVAALPRLSSLLDAPHSDLDAPGEFGEARSLRALGRFLDALGTAERPVLLIFDDCQWADESTCKLIQRWQARGSESDEPRHVSLVVAFREEEVDDEHILRRLRPLAHVQLAPLGPAEIRRLAESMAGPLPDEVVELVVRLADGSPFMASAVLQGLVESGGLAPAADGWKVEKLAIPNLQSSSQAANFLAHRIELLPDETIQLLSIGAVLGKEFDLDIAASLVQQDAVEIISALDAARQRRLVWVRPDESRCVFVHDRIRSAILNRMTAAQRRSIHRRAAEHLKQQRRVRASDLAYHFDAAGDPASALPHALAAAEQACAQHSLEIAEQQYRIAQRGAVSAEKSLRYRIAEGLGDVLMLRGCYAEAAELFGSAVALAEGSYARAQIRGKLGELAFKRGDMEQAVQDFESALRSLGHYVPRNMVVLLAMLAFETVRQALHTLLPRVFVHRVKEPPGDPARLTIQLCSGLAHGCWYARSKAYSLWAHLRGINLAEKYPPTPELAHAYSEHAPAMTLVPYFSRGIQYAEKSLKIRESLGDLWGQGQSYHYYGVVLFAASRYSECIDKCREAVRLLERMGDYWQVHIARYQIAASLYRLGDLRGAIEEAQLNHKSGLELGDEQASGIILDVWARASGGRLPDEILQREVERTRNDAQGTSQVLLAHSVCLLSKGQPKHACEVLESAIDAVQQAGIKNAYSLPPLAWLATARRSYAETLDGYTPAVRTRLLKQATRDVRRALRAARMCKNDLPHVHREYGLLLTLLGRPRRARVHFDRSLRIAQRHGARYEHAQSLLARGRVGIEMGWPDAQQDITTAQTELTELDGPTGLGDEQDGGSEPVTLSLANRFDIVLDSGRKIASSLSKHDIYQDAQAAALRLLRGEHCLVLEVSDQKCHDQQPVVVVGEADRGYNPALVRRALRAGRAVVSSNETADVESDVADLPNDVIGQAASICAPIFVRGDATACLYATHSQLSRLFGPDEQRLAEFIATLTGAALENAEGFQQLETLNATLEQRVAERTAAAEDRAQELAVSNQELERVAHELRLTDEQLRIAVGEAESANRAKSQFLATMSHEIRTPMNGILGMTQLALQTPLSLQQKRYLTTVKQSGDALLTLLNDILDLSKIEAGKMDLEQIPTWLRETVEDAVKVMTVTAAMKGIELCCRVSPDTPAAVTGDPNRLRQIIVNLVSNALKFTSEGEVLVHVWTEGRDEENTQVHFAVKDTGIGIPPDKQQSIFESFQQSDSSTTRRFGGTGLGLTISAQLVSLMGGRLWVESEVGEGSTFHFVIPFHTQNNVASPNTVSLVLGRRRVLLLSNRPTNRETYTELLASFDMDVTSVASKQQAIDTYRRLADLSAPPELILIDIDKRDLEGWAEMKIGEFLPEGEDQGCPILRLIPADQISAASGESAAEAECFLTKPATTPELIEAMAEAIGLFCHEAPQSDESDSDAGHSRSLRILLADDSPVNQDVASGLLELRGHQVEVVDNGREAVDALQGEPFDILLMDVEMPVMDGIEATRLIRQQEAGTPEHLPIVAMTAHAVKGFEKKCLEAGMDGYICKPLQPDELFAAIESIVARPTPSNAIPPGPPSPAASSPG